MGTLHPHLVVINAPMYRGRTPISNPSIEQSSSKYNIVELNSDNVVQIIMCKKT